MSAKPVKNKVAMPPLPAANKMQQIKSCPMPAIRKVLMPSGDPQAKFKTQVFEALGMKCCPMTNKPADCRGSLLELSSLSVLPENFHAMIKEAEAVLIAPALDGSPGMIADLDKASREKLIPALPMRYWGMVENTSSFCKSGNASELVSFRVCMNLPKHRKGMFGDFCKSFLTQVVDIACLVADAKPEDIYIKQTAGFNSAFGIVKFPKNIIAELDVNECLADTLDPIRFIHAYCKEGAISNLPLNGYTNAEGALVATADGVARPVLEHNIWDGGDELDNFYFRMIYKIRNRESLPASGIPYRQLAKAVAAAVSAGGAA